MTGYLTARVSKRSAGESLLLATTAISTWCRSCVCGHRVEAHEMWSLLLATPSVLQFLLLLLFRPIGTTDETKPTEGKSFHDEEKKLHMKSSSDNGEHTASVSCCCSFWF